MKISVFRLGVRPWPEVEINQATGEDLLSFIKTRSSIHDISDDLDHAVWDEALRRMTGSASQEMKLESAQQQIAALEARNRELREKVRACIDRHQDIFSWQKGESRNGLVVEIRDKVDAIFAALKGVS